MPTYYPGHADDAGPLIPALDVLLGYAPTETAVVWGFDRANELVVVAVAELGTAHGPDEIALRLVRRLPSEDVRDVLVLVISAEPATELVQKIARAAAAGAMTVSVLVSATGTRPPATWACCCGCGQGGPVPDLDTGLAARAVIDGHRTFDSFADLTATIAPADDDVLARRARLLTDPPAPAPGSARHALARALDEHSRTQQELTDQTVLDLHRGLADQTVVIQTLLERTSAMRLLLEAGVRATPQPWRATPAIYLLFAAQLNGHSMLAQTIAQRLLDSGNVGPFAVLADLLATECPSPEQIRRRLTDLL